MEDHRLKAFCLIVEMKSFSKAAEAKFMTQSALSHLIKNLEDKLGIKLLNRHAKEITPTKAGELFMSMQNRFLHNIKNWKIVFILLFKKQKEYYILEQLQQLLYIYYRKCFTIFLKTIQKHKLNYQ